ncbi:hypothetical protein QOZ80_8AG0619160 [Eleusine coracana subsp. coracana]|nr:hypothetical protein QOZ80_8AG0619130 [Eleusine coracana subsp. coracana]KAK3122843.1 hypothetical protein QOZ80_8AG0619160 [Eleusine coracana subsp. coracana]
MILDLGPLEILSILQGLCITCISLQVGSACAGVVNVWAEDGDDKYAIGTLSPEAPTVALQPHFLVAGDNWVVRHDAVAATVRFYACIPSVAGEDEDGGEWEVEVDDEAPRVEFRPATEEEDAERNDSDNDDFEDDEEDEPPPKLRLRPNDTAGESSKNNDSTSLPLVAAPPGTIVPGGQQFLGPAQFAAVENTAAFMRVAAEEGSTSTNQDRKEITVLYRYTRFSRTWSGRRGVEPCRRTKLHRLRFTVPPAGDVAGSMAWAGAALGSLVYPALFHRQLQQLWTMTMEAASINNIPPRATRVHVVVDAAILRREDHTTERMEHMRPALETLMQEAWPELYYHVSKDLDLPEPLRRREDEDEQGGGEDDARPAKQMKIVDEVGDCCVCFDPLENGLAAWPGCRHVFHAECLQGTLARSDTCPLCRMNLCARAPTNI